MHPLDEYDALVAKVDAFVARASVACASGLTCHAGCDACCHAALAVSAVEAAAIERHLGGRDAAARAAIADHARAAASDGAAERSIVRPGARCAFLDGTGRCSIYAARPLVCRTQGLALRYPAGVIPVDAIRLRGASGDVTWCPLNFAAAPPPDGATLDAELVDRLLAVVARRFADATGADPLARVPLADLAADGNASPFPPTQ